MNVTDKQKRTALMIACLKRNVDSINVLLRVGSDTNITDISGNTCLMQAVSGDCSKEVLQAIIDHGADVNVTNKENHTALTIACAKRYTDDINVLLEAEADPNIADDSGATCLMHAVFKDGSKDMLHAIIDHGADVDATSKENCIALMIACGKNSVGAIYVLLESGADINITDIDGDTCLMHAVVGNCSKEVLQAIIDHGADVNATNKENHTALMSACQLSDACAITVLLGSGADPNTADDNGDTCLHVGILKNLNKEVIQTIIDHGANVDAINKLNVTPLMVASNKGNADAINLLLNARADPNITSVNGGTWLHAALEGDCSREALQVIIEHGTDVNATNILNVTPLELASEKRKIDAIMLLLNAGAKPSLYLYPKGRKMVNWYKLRVVLHGHKKDVTGVCPAYFPEGSFVSVSRDITARLWVPNEHDASFTEGHMESGHINLVTNVCVMPPDEKYPCGLIMTGSSDHAILAYTLDSPQPVFKLEGHTNDMCSLAAGKVGTLLSASLDKTAKVWFNQKCVVTLAGHEGAVWAVAIMDEADCMLTGSADKLIKLWKAGKCQQTYAGHTQLVSAVAFLSTSEFLSASNDTTIRHWLTTEECVHRYSGHTSFVYSLALLPNGEDFASCSEDRTVRVWSNRQCVQIIAHPAESVWTVCALENGDIVTGASDGAVRLFTTSPERAAEDSLQKAFEGEVTTSVIPSLIGDINMDQPSGPEALPNAGELDDQTIPIQQGNKAEAHQ